jgi:hypothetical protein
MPEYPIDADLAAVTSALGGLSPAAPALDRDRLLYEAGRRSVRSRPWPVVAGLMAIVSAGLAVRLATVPPRIEVVYISPAPVSRDALAERDEVPRSASASRLTDPPSATAGYFGLLDRVVRFGGDSPSMSAAPTAPPQPVEQLLGLPRGTLTDTQKTRWAHQLSRGDV